MLHPHMQVLTAHGFIPVAQLHHHRVANIDPNSGHLIGYSQCTSEQFPYNGDMYHITGAVDALFTPDNPIYISLSNTQDKRRYPRFERLPASCIHSPSRWARGASGTDLYTWSDIQWARLIGFIIGDGHASSRNIISFHLSRQRKIDWLTQLCTQMALPFNTHPYNRYTIQSPDIGIWCRKTLYSPNGDKRIPLHFLSASQAVIEGLIDGLMTSDGHLHTLYTTTSPQVADTLLALGAISGHLFSIAYRQDMYRLNRIRRLHYPHVNDSRSKATIIQTEAYIGDVYRVTTETGVIVAKMNMRTVLIGSELFPKSDDSD